MGVCGKVAAVLTVGTWFALLLGFLGELAWQFDLFANFRVQYLGIFALCVIASTLARRRAVALVALLGVALTTASMAQYFAASKQAETTLTAQFRLMTFNAWFRNEDWAAVARYLENSDADAIVLQEVSELQAQELAANMPSYPHRTVAADPMHSVVVFSRMPLLEVTAEGLAGGLTRASRVSLAWQGQRITILGTHLHWPLGSSNAAARNAELQHLSELARHEAGPLLLAGDFNLTSWSRYFATFVSASGLNECALGQGLLATWPAQLRPARIRIDHCFASAHWRVRRVSIGPSVGSDHLPLIADLELASAP